MVGNVKTKDIKIPFGGLTHRNCDVETRLNNIRHLYPLSMARTEALEDRCGDLFSAFGSPQDDLSPVVHIAGTNGKGSVLAYIQAFFEAAGLSVHKHTSPHLVDFNERIVLNGRQITDEELLELIEKFETINQDKEVRFFDAITIMAFEAFSKIPTDITLIETGLGGRLDATNLIKSPRISVISSISLDHTEILGDNHADIAYEKGGIIKENVPCIVGVQEKSEVYDIISNIAQDKNAPIFQYQKDWDIYTEDNHIFYKSNNWDLKLPMPALYGAYQVLNAGLALAVVENLTEFDISEQEMATGMKNVKWAGRLQHLSKGSMIDILPKQAELWLDGGHNVLAAEMLAKQMAEWKSINNDPIDLVFCMMNKRDPVEFIEPMAKYCRSIWAVPLAGVDIALSENDIAEQLHDSGICNILTASSYTNAMQQISKLHTDIKYVLLTGSLYLAGDVLSSHE